MATKLYFYELDVTNFEKHRLAYIYKVLYKSWNGWNDKIENLEMVVDDYNHIIIRGWATKCMWQKFMKKLVNAEVPTWLRVSRESLT